MAIEDVKILPTAGIASKVINRPLTITQSLTSQVALISQIRSGFAILSASVFTRLYTATIGLDVGIVAPGSTLGAVTLTIGGTTTKFKVNSAVLGISTAIDPNTGLPTIVQKAITDNNVFSSAFTVNTAAAAGTFWGAVRIQMDVNGVITTKVVSADQTFPTEALAIANAPAANVGQINLGTISINPATGVTYTAGTTALTGAGITVNYNGVTDGFVTALTGAIAPVAANYVAGVMAAFINRSLGVKGGLLVARYTTDGSAAITDCELDVTYRPYPLNGEVITNPIPG